MTYYDYVNIIKKLFVVLNCLYCYEAKKKLNRDLGTRSDLKQFSIVNIDVHSITTVLYDHRHRRGA